jgi:hypothetical protein
VGVEGEEVLIVRGIRIPRTLRGAPARVLLPLVLLCLVAGCSARAEPGGSLQESPSSNADRETATSEPAKTANEAGLASTEESTNEPTATPRTTGEPTSAGSGNGTREATADDDRDAGEVNRREEPGREASGPPPRAGSGGASRGSEDTGTAVVEGTEDGFTAAPEASGGVAGAADSVLGVRFGVHDGYERAVVDFGLNGGAAPAPPVWKLSSPAGDGNARVYLPGVTQTSVTDGSFGGAIMDRYYVVRAADGSLFVDFYATDAFRYRVEGLADPGRLALDYEASVSELGYPQPAFGERTVLTSPRAGAAVGGAVTVSGYSRNFEARNAIQLLSPTGSVLAETTATSSDWAETWGAFEATLRVPPFEGTGTLRAGAFSARDGSFDGVEVPVTYAGG